MFVIPSPKSLGLLMETVVFRKEISTLFQLNETSFCFDPYK